MAHGRRWLIGAASVVALSVVLVLITVGGQPSLAEDGIIYVNAEATGPGYDGSTWETAFTGLQDALDAAVPPVEIWVAAGTYTPTLPFEPEDDRTASFQMANGVAIYGGFDPSAGAVAFEDRNWMLHETILSGDLNGDDGPEFANNAENSYHVFYHPEGTNLDSSAILDGFTITGGNADAATEPHNSGGGMFNDASSPTLANITFAGNQASGGSGGGMYNYQSSPELTGCTFTGNSAHVSENSGGSGGAMHNSSGSSPTLTNCTFQANTAGTEGGGIHNDGSSPTLTGCTFSGNTADAGGGIYNGSNALPDLLDCTFAGNSANSGGGMHNDASSPVLVNCTFAGNSAAGNGGGLRNTRDSSPTVTNCTFHGNRATNGGAIHNYEISAPTLTNCILWGDSKPEIYNFDSGSTPDVTYSDVEGSYLYLGTGNINEDPLFLDPDNGDFHLLPRSPCIDAGTNEAPSLPEHDFEGDPRSLDGDRDGTATADMGVDEALWHPVYLPLVLRGY